MGNWTRTLSIYRVRLLILVTGHIKRVLSVKDQQFSNLNYNDSFNNSTVFLKTQINLTFMMSTHCRKLLVLL